MSDNGDGMDTQRENFRRGSAQYRDRRSSSNRSREVRNSIRRSRSRNRRSPRDRSHRSKSRSRSHRDRTFSPDNTRLIALEIEIQREKEKIRDRERRRSSRRRNNSKTRSRDRSSHQNTRRDCHDNRDRSLVTPTKRGFVGNDKDDNTKPKMRTSEFFEQFIDALKNVKAGDREPFATLNTVVPEFDPLSKEQTINVWIDKVDECAEIYNWSDKQTVHYALPKLTGHAKTWYQGLPSIKHNWLEWKTMLKESFPSSENYAELLTEMLNRRVRPGESLEIYYFAKINLLNRCKIFGKQAVDCILYGIEDRGVRVGAQAAKFDKPEDVLDFLKTIKLYNRNFLDSNRDKRNALSYTSNNALKSNDSESDKD